jgi:hypothetical protein
MAALIMALIYSTIAFELYYRTANSKPERRVRVPSHIILYSYDHHAVFIFARSIRRQRPQSFNNHVCILCLKLHIRNYFLRLSVDCN